MLVIVSKGHCSDHGFHVEPNCMHPATEFGLEDATLANGTISSSKANCRIIDSDGPVLQQFSTMDLPCTEEIPCVCRADNLRPLEVCETGVFDPDPFTYYTIASHSGNFLTTDRSTMVRVGLEEISDTNVHWRFVPGEESGTWTIRNRGSGEEIFASGSAGFLGRAPSRLKFDPVCEKAGVNLSSETRKDLSPRDCCGAPFAHNRRANDVKMSASTLRDVTISKQSSCVKKHRTCTSMFGEGFVQVSRRLCGLGASKALKCERFFGRPVIGLLPTAWNITEVQEFTPAVVSKNDPLEPLESTFNANDFITDNLAGVLVESGSLSAVAGVGGLLAIVSAKRTSFQ